VLRPLPRGSAPHARPGLQRPAQGRACCPGTVEEPFYFAGVCGLDLASGQVTNYTKTPEQYDEAESAFPDGRRTMVESDRHGVNRKWKIDVYRLALDLIDHTGSWPILWGRALPPRNLPGRRARRLAPVVGDDQIVSTLTELLQRCEAGEL